MALLDTRLVYKPFEYPECFDYLTKQQQAFWLPNEISLASDVNDWKTVLTDKEKHIIGNVLKGFTQAEVIIGDYWSNKVANWFKKSELQMMANTFASFEAIHAISYSMLNDTLGLEDYDAFLYDPAAKARIDRLIETKGKSRKEIARSLAIFSAFGEGVTLFSAFMILLSFSRFNKMRGVGQIISFSIKDESLHSEAGCFLFRTFCREYPEILDDELKKEIYDAARLTVQLEDDFIEMVFKQGDIEGLTKEEVKNYIRFRTNTKLQDLGLKSNWKNINKEMIDQVAWFDIMSSGVEHQDFFANRVTSYSKGSIDFDNIFD